MGQSTDQSTDQSTPLANRGLVVAVSMYTIPEGNAVSVPIYYATGERGLTL